MGKVWESVGYLQDSVGKDLNLGQPRTNPASGQSGTRTWDRRIASLMR